MCTRTEQLGLQQISLSVFDHWLSRDEASRLLEAVEREEQISRDMRFFTFAVALSDRTEMLDFAERGRRRDRLQFRKFARAMVYFDSAIKRRGGRRHVVLPSLDALLIEAWDDTWQLIFRNLQQVEIVLEQASIAGLFVLR